MSKWEKISREKVLEHKYFQVSKDVVRLPSGEEIEWLFWDSDDSTMVVGETDEGQLVMIKQFRYLPNEVALEFPSGGSHEGETLEECARREFEEETGYVADRLIKMGGFFETMAQLNKKIHLYYAPQVKPAINRNYFSENTEDIEVVLFDPEELNKKIIANQVSSMGTCFAYYLYKEFKKNA